MPALNFMEISAAHIADGMQDSFELFARDILKIIGLEIISGPDRGQDGGRDLLSIEQNGKVLTYYPRTYFHCMNRLNVNIAEKIY
jgi:hypothetical protein